MKPYNGAYQPNNPNPYKISRSKIELWYNCPRCFYLDRVLKIARPSGPPFNINSAVDSLLKREFDIHRADGRRHPIQDEYGIDARPAPHELLDKWRENFHGIQYLHEPTNMLIFGALDDLWIDSAGRYIVVDYKATAKTTPVTELGDAPWHDQYRRQIEFYQWLLRRNGLDVSDIGYWVYCTGDPGAPSFDKKVEFAVHLIDYRGDDGWVEGAIEGAKKCLDSTVAPPTNPACEYCSYIEKAKKID